MMRATAPGGTLVLSHLHNALCDNPSPGMPLTPAGYRRLFAERKAVLFKQSAMLDAVAAGDQVELGAGFSDDDLSVEPALMLVAGDLPRGRPQPTAGRHARWGVNPLYTSADDPLDLQLRFPSDFYAEEFADCRRYLPERVRLPRNWQDAANAVDPDGRTAELIARHVLLDLPERYL
jgi:hypothetical protein